MKQLLPLALCTAAAAHAGIPVTGGPTFQWPNPEQLQQLAEQHMLVAQQYQQLAQAQQVQQATLRNEAVRVLPNGRRIVEEPPGPKARAKPPTGDAYWSPGYRAPSYVIATATGLKECGWPWISQGCRDYIPKRDRRERAWVVKQDGRWIKCPQRDSTVGCVGYYDLPSMLIQE